MDTTNKENSDDTYESSTGGEASADYIIRGAGGDTTTTEGGGGITDKIKDKIKGTKDKVSSTADRAADTTKKGISSTTTTTNQQDREYEEGEAGTRFDRKKDPTKEYDEKEPMSPAKIKQHEPTAVRRDFTDQKIMESGRERESSDDGHTREKSKTIYDEDKQGAAREQETTVPLTEERLGVSKTASSREATITKEPVTETKTVEVPVTHEE
ncbi:MAG: hypothetical protein JO297_03915, partial [Nitrososphaeraceae archaeon]|nr:hypothetical protein [Nitrososphaeraceae archaeon]